MNIDLMSISGHKIYGNKVEKSLPLNIFLSNFTRVRGWELFTLGEDLGCGLSQLKMVADRYPSCQHDRLYANHFKGERFAKWHSADPLGGWPRRCLRACQQGDGIRSPACQEAL